MCRCLPFSLKNLQLLLFSLDNITFSFPIENLPLLPFSYREYAVVAIFLSRICCCCRLRSSMCRCLPFSLKNLQLLLFSIDNITFSFPIENLPVFCFDNMPFFTFPIQNIPLLPFPVEHVPLLPFSLEHNLLPILEPGDESITLLSAHLNNRLRHQ